MSPKPPQTHSNLIEGLRSLQLEYLLQSDSLLLLHYIEHRLRLGGVRMVKHEEMLTPLYNLHNQLSAQQEQVNRMVALIEQHHENS